MNGGLRMTEQRRVILEELGKSVDHPTADEIYERVRRRLPRISLGTVYRNLERMATAGIITRIDFPGARMRFDADDGRHVHVRCIRCGRVEDVEREPEREDFDLVIDEGSGFRILEKRIEYLGICPECEDGERREKERRGGGYERKS